ncbi:uncharacterized protein EV420DRAFT_1766064 [Desarmillaria tabescens]|uniref:F-box domain-containing protein n=1 Tax=Armillaria tabescens TaxID=1929756 RepID=A0AA39K1Q5_ARMTA|nr:uncharacterized protein EV420DRAFT_1766064 [Desarmillaria tabescens]KAK0452992.1 hypothetical protein EV420DRAFT_1766064 [Desarmillaria tabescens]
MSFDDQPTFPTERIAPPRQLQTRSDYVPSAADVCQIKESLSAIEKEVHRYDDELFRLYTLVAQREAEQRELKLNAEKCRSILAPIRRLPNEMLSEIFAQCCKEGDEDVNCMSDTRTLSALSISLVCSRWRTLAISTKSLWAVFSITPTDVSTFSMQCLRMYISRSGDVPLTIQVPNTYVNVPAAALAGASQFYNVLLDAAPRWRKIEIATIYFGQRLSPIKHHLQNLEELNVDSECLFAADPDIFVDAPKLRTLTVFVTSEGVFHTFPYHQISDLSLCIRCPYASFVNFLSKFPRVQNLELEGYLDSSGNIQGQAKTDLTTVQTLCINMVDMIPFVVRAFTFPRLESITLVCNDTAQSSRFMPIYRPFLELLEPSHGLKMLVLEQIDVEDQEMIAILRLTPSLIELSIQCTDIILAEIVEDCKTLRDGFVRSLTFSPPIIQSQNPPVANLLPKLTSLDLALNTSSTMHDALVDMLTSRWHPPALVSVHERVSCLDSVTLRNIVKPEHATTVSQLQDRAGEEHHFRWLDSKALSLTRKRK